MSILFSNYNIMEFDRDSFATIFNEQSAEEVPNICNHNFNFIAGYCTCTNCGMIDVHRHAFTNYNKARNKCNSLREKLKQMVGIKQSLCPDYMSVLDKLRSQKFNQISDLKKILKKLRYHKYYKYIYSIYSDIRGIKLINLSNTDIGFLATKFLQLENIFKKRNNCKRNILSYNIMIYCILKKYNYDCYKYIILPKKYRKLLKVVEDLLNL